MIIYNIMFILIKYNINNNVDAKFIFASFNQNTWKVIHVIAILKPLKMQLFYFILILETILENIPIDCPTVVIGDFNVDMLTSISWSKKLQNIMNKCRFKNINLKKTYL
jgi:hypothetical protein